MANIKKSAMKEFVLDNHVTYCKNHEYGHRFCELNPERFLFCAGNKFFLITYQKCMDCGDEYEFKKELIRMVLDKIKEVPTYELRRSISVKDDLMDFRIRNRALKKWIYQAHYLYYNNAGKEFAIASKIPYMDAICNYNEFEDNYKKAKDVLTERGYKWLFPKLEKLYMKNIMFDLDQTEIHKSIDHLVKSINQQINN